MKSYSMLDHVLVVKQLIEKEKDFNIPLYMGFIGFRKAFDTIKHSFIFKALEQIGIEKGYIELVKEIYSDTWAIVSLEKLGQEFSFQRGVKQGDPLSPDLFNCVIQKAFNDLTNVNRGISILGNILTNLRFADDMVIFQNSAKNLELSLQELTDVCKPAGLKLNLDKTFILTNGTKSEITINNIPLKYTEETTYLGQVITFDDMMEK